MLAPSWRLRLAFVLCWALAVDCKGPESTLVVFSSLQRSDAYQMPPYPAGTQLSLTCQMAGNHATYWYEKNATTNPVELPSESHNTNGVHWSVYNIKPLGKNDHGRTLMCMKDASTMREDVNLNVVDQPPLGDIAASPGADGGENLRCVAKHVSSQLKLCWYRGMKKLQCQEPLGNQESTTVNITCNDLKGQSRGSVFQCKPQLKDDAAMDVLTKNAQDRFSEMFKKATKEYKLKRQDITHCEEMRRHTKPSTRTQTSTAKQQPNETTTPKAATSKKETKTTTPSNETGTTTPSKESKQSETLPTTTTLPIASPPTASVTPAGASSTSTATNPGSLSTTPATKQPNWNFITALLITVIALLLALLMASVILILKVKRSKGNGNQAANMCPGDGTVPVNDIARRQRERQGQSHVSVRAEGVESGQSEPEVEDYPGAVDTSDHRWPREGVPLGHAYYYPDITEQVREQILKGDQLLTSRYSRKIADAPMDSTQPYNAINHSYHYPVLTQEMKRLLSGNRGQGNRRDTRVGSGTSH